MKILAIETSTLAGGVALMDHNRLIAEYRLDVVVHHSERILSAINHLLLESDTEIKALDAIAISAGPGSFTGLRVGLSTAKGLAIGGEKALILVPTLEALAAVFPYTHSGIVPWIEARREEVYWAFFACKNGGMIRCARDAADTPRSALRKVERLRRSRETISGQILFVGNGAIRYREDILEVMPKTACFPPRTLQFPSAAAVAEIGLSKLERGETTAPELAMPSYVRASTPEIKRQEASAKPSSGG